MGFPARSDTKVSLTEGLTSCYRKGRRFFESKAFRRRSIAVAQSVRVVTTALLWPGFSAGPIFRDTCNGFEPVSLCPKSGFSQRSNEVH